MLKLPVFDSRKQGHPWPCLKGLVMHGQTFRNYKQGCLNFLLLTTLLIFVLLLNTSCSTFGAKSQETNSLLASRRFDEAAEKLKPLAAEEGNDQLVYLFEYGTALHYAGKYEESNRAFLKADKLSEIQDYTSLSREAGSLLLSETMVQYKGDDYEKVLINAYLAMNYMLLGKMEDAAVEARRLNEKLVKYKEEAKRNYEQNPFARYISAMAYENQQNWDSAYIDYKNTYQLIGPTPQLKADLIRTAKKAHRQDDLDMWKQKFPDVQVDPGFDSKGEIVLLYEQGNGPRKRPNPAFTRVPKLYPQPSWGKFARLEIQGVASKQTDYIYSVEQVAIKTLDDAYAGIIAKRVAGIATKAVVADQIRQKNELLGALAWIGMNAADQADLRQWSSLPQSLQIARVSLPAGEYTVQVKTYDNRNTPTGEDLPPSKIKVAAHRKTFVNWRSFQ